MRKGGAGWFSKFQNFNPLCTGPRIKGIVRKALGRAYLAMGGGRHNDEMIAWPTAEVSFMDPSFAATIVPGFSTRDERF